MTLTVIPGDCRWISGSEVDGLKSTMRQVDTQFCMQILGEAPIPWATMQAIRNQLAGATGGVFPTLIRYAENPTYPATPHPFTGPAQKNYFTTVENINATCASFLRSRMGIVNLPVSEQNLLSSGDFTFAFSDFLVECNNLMALPTFPTDNGTVTAWRAGLRELCRILAALPNRQAFNKLTNRVRIKRWNVLNGYPSLGITNWQLPADDVLGAIDRLLGYYETADISGSTPNAIFAYCFMDKFCNDRTGVNDILTQGEIDVFPATLNQAVWFGTGLAAMAPMVAQMHHSLPECMMAINLMPRDIRVDPGNDRREMIYSPYLTNANFTHPRYNEIVEQWRITRSTLFGQRDHYADQARSIILLQDIYQMSNVPNPKNEIGIIMAYEIDARSEPNRYDFGDSFYNAVVDDLNTPWRGPAIPLEQLSCILHWRFRGANDIAVPGNDTDVGRALLAQFPGFAVGYPNYLRDLWSKFDDWQTPAHSTQRAVVPATLFPA